MHVRIICIELYVRSKCAVYFWDQKCYLQKLRKRFPISQILCFAYQCKGLKECCIQSRQERGGGNAMNLCALPGVCTIMYLYFYFVVSRLQFSFFIFLFFCSESPFQKQNSSYNY